MFDEGRPVAVAVPVDPLAPRGSDVAIAVATVVVPVAAAAGERWLSAREYARLLAEEMLVMSLVHARVAALVSCAIDHPDCLDVALASPRVERTDSLDPLSARLGLERRSVANVCRWLLSCPLFAGRAAAARLAQAAPALARLLALRLEHGLLRRDELSNAPLAGLLQVCVQTRLQRRQGVLLLRQRADLEVAAASHPHALAERPSALARRRLLGLLHDQLARSTALDEDDAAAAAPKADAPAAALEPAAAGGAPGGARVGSIDAFVRRLFSAVGAAPQLVDLPVELAEVAGLLVAITTRWLCKRTADARASGRASLALSLLPTSALIAIFARGGGGAADAAAAQRTPRLVASLLLARPLFGFGESVLQRLLRVASEVEFKRQRYAHALATLPAQAGDAVRAAVQRGGARTLPAEGSGSAGADGSWCGGGGAPGGGCAVEATLARVRAHAADLDWGTPDGPAHSAGRSGLRARVRGAVEAGVQWRGAEAVVALAGKSDVSRALADLAPALSAPVFELLQLGDLAALFKELLRATKAALDTAVAAQRAHAAKAGAAKAAEAHAHARDARAARQSTADARARGGAQHEPTLHDLPDLSARSAAAADGEAAARAAAEAEAASRAAEAAEALSEAMRVHVSQGYEACYAFVRQLVLQSRHDDGDGDGDGDREVEGEGERRSAGADGGRVPVRRLLFALLRWALLSASVGQATVELAAVTGELDPSEDARLWEAVGLHLDRCARDGRREPMAAADVAACAEAFARLADAKVCDVVDAARAPLSRASPPV